MTRSHTVSKPETRVVINLEVHCWTYGTAPTGQRWACCLRDHDEDSVVFSGPTQREAIDALLDYYEEDNGELRE